MKLAIIGAGNVGGTLGTAWAQKGRPRDFLRRHAIRTPKRRKRCCRQSAARRAPAPRPRPAAFGEMIVLTTPWPAAEAAIRSMGDLERQDHP